MSTEQTWLVNYRLIIRDATNTYLWLLPTATHLNLPTWQLPLQHFWQDVAHINSWVKQHFGLNTRVLRCLQIDDDFDQQHMTVTYDLIAEPTKPIDSEHWFAIDAVMGDQRIEPQLAAMLALWQAQRCLPNSVPWYQPDWGQAAWQWVKTVVEHAGIQPIGAFKQHRTWNRSSIWQLATNHGRLYFKALPAMFAHEIALTQHLQIHEPTHTPTLLALEPHQGWLLMPDFAAPNLSQHSQIEQWQLSLQSYAQLQIRQLGMLEQLEACGLAIRPLAWLSQNIEPLLNDAQATLLGQPWGLTAEELAILHQAIPQIKAACTALQAFNLPETLEHGDLGPSNIIINGQRIVFTDWSDASISHPFFSLGLWLEGVETRFSLIPDVRELLLHSYLSVWSAHLGLDYPTLRQAYRYAEILTLIHQALTYQHWIKPYLHAAWELEAMIPAYLRQLITGLER